MRQLAELYARMGVDLETCSVSRWSGSRSQCKEMSAVFGLTWLIAAEAREARQDPFFAEEADIGPFPSAAFDQYTREGIRAYAYFLNACPPVARWMDENGVNPKSRIRLLGRLVFRAEGDHLNPRLQIPEAFVIRYSYIKEVAESYSIEPEQFFRGIELVKLNLAMLRRARTRSWASQSRASRTRWGA